MIYLILTVHVIVSLFLILVVLLQRGSGADLSVFGGGGTQAAFGARSAASVLHRMTVWGFIAFIVTTISYNFLASDRNRDSVLSGAASAPAAVNEAATEPITGAADESVPESAATAPETPPAEATSDESGDVPPDTAD